MLYLLVYLHVPSSAIQATDIKLSFSLKSDATVPKSWNIQIGLLPCGALYLGIMIIIILNVNFKFQQYFFTLQNSSSKLSAVVYSK